MLRHWLVLWFYLRDSAADAVSLPLSPSSFLLFPFSPLLIPLFLFPSVAHLLVICVTQRDVFRKWEITGLESWLKVKNAGCLCRGPWVSSQYHFGGFQLPLTPALRNCCLLWPLQANQHKYCIISNRPTHRHINRFIYLLFFVVFWGLGLSL